MSEPDWRAAYQRAVQDATLALSSEAALKAIASRLCPNDAELEAMEILIKAGEWCGEMPHVDERNLAAQSLRGFVARAKENRSMLERRG